MRGWLLPLCLLAGCTDPGAGREAAARRFVGESEAALVRALGAPARTIDGDGRRVLAYVERRMMMRPIAPSDAWHPGLPPAMRQDELVELTCETTYEVVGGVVREVRQAGNGCG